MTKTNKPRRMARPPAADAINGTAKPERTTKQYLVLQLLSREGGAPLDAITEATGWLPHTARVALTGLRRKGHDVVRIRIDGETCHSVAGPQKQ